MIDKKQSNGSEPTVGEDAEPLRYKTNRLEEE